MTHFDTPEDAYYGFFEADRAKDAAAWAGVMRYPHVRVAAAGGTDYFETSRDYADAADWTEREATGWVRTRGRQPTRLHESSDRVHLVGGWTRYNAADAPILWNRVTYIVTRPAGLHGSTSPPTWEPEHFHTRQRSGKTPPAEGLHGSTPPPMEGTATLPHASAVGDASPAEGSWGIQARFALGAYDGRDDEAAAESAARSAIAQVRRYYDAVDANDGGVCAALCRFPMMEVGVGEVARIEDGDQLARRVRRERDRITDFEIGAAQSGADGVIVALTAEYASGGREQSILVVGRGADTWRIAGISRIRTQA